MRKSLPCEPPRQRHARGRRRRVQGLSLVFPAVLLAACGSSPIPGAGPDNSGASPVPRPPQAQRSPTDRQSPQPPALAPLATPQQVVKAVSVGRRDPFGNVLVPTVIQPPEAPSNAGGSRSPAPPKPLPWPKGLAFEGVLQTFAGAEAMVSYLPEEAGGGGTRAGSVQVGDTSVEKPGLLPPGWQVAAIDGNRGVLVLRKGMETVSRRLPTL